VYECGSELRFTSPVSPRRQRTRTCVLLLLPFCCHRAHRRSPQTLAELKDPNHFGQFGTVLKLFMSKRTPLAPQQGVASSHYQPVNVYVNYRTASEASHCIAATDGTVTPEGHRLKAVWGTTKYCSNYLKGIRCHLANCNDAHEQGEEIEGGGSLTRDEIFT
jgi:hypothetical protein